MEPVFTVDQERWRAEVRAFLDEEVPVDREVNTEFVEDESVWQFALEFTRKLAKRGWISLSWPREYGGLGRPLVDELIFSEELERREAPIVNHTGWGLVAPALLSGGTDEQRRRFLPPIAHMETLWVEGYTEPGAGSDLASLSTRAVRKGSDWIINGQKTYTTWGHRGDNMYLAARTDPDAPRHHGISIFCLDLKQRGISFSALHNIAGGRQNHTYLDDVRVPHDMLIGQENQGWSLIMNSFYASPKVMARHAAFQRIIDKLVDYCRETRRYGRTLIDQEWVRDILTELEMIAQSLRLLTYQSVGERAAGRAPALAGALPIVVEKESMPRFAELVNQILGPEGQLSAGPFAPLAGLGVDTYLRSFADHAGGTSQVKRMVLATRGLGLPR
jgi:3-oxocholest-4-en-26-oyl-CoA dehydrogenase alpha subunit